MNKNRYLWLLSLAVIMLANLIYGGTWTPNQFIYQPSMGARGETEYNNFNTGMKRVDNHLGKFKTLGDPGYATLTEALTTIGGDAATLNIPAGAVPVNTDTTVPENVHLRVLKGADLQVADGATLTINGTIEAGPYQIFSWTGAGQFSFGRQKTGYAEWFGAVGDDSTDNTSALNKAITSDLEEIYLQGTYQVTTVTHETDGVYLVGAGQQATVIKQSAASGVCIDCTPSAAIGNAGLKNLTVQGAATGAVADNHGVSVKDVLWGYHLENVEIKSFGDDGFHSEGACYGCAVNNVIIRDCYDIGYHIKKADYRHNGNNIFNLRIYGCDTGLKINDCYNVNFFGLAIEDDVTDVKDPDNLAIWVYNSKNINFYNPYVEWNKTDQTELILIDTIVSGVNFWGIQCSTDDSNSVVAQFIKYSAANYCNIYGGEFIWNVDANALTQGINLSTATCNYNTFINTNIRVGSGKTGTITTKVSDSGSLNLIYLDGCVYPNELALMATTTTNYVVGGRDDGDSNRRWGIYADGTIRWGDGSAVPDTILYRDAADILKTDDSFTYGDMATVASAGALTLPAGNFINVTGTTNITSITANDCNGRLVVLKFAGILDVTDGSNLKLAGNFTTSADDTITLVSDGTNWYEVGRSAN